MEKINSMILVSACLLGVPCRYNGSPFPPERRFPVMDDLLLVPVCPEVLGGLPTPRAPAEIEKGDGRDVLTRRACVRTADRRDVTDAYRLGARRVLSIARAFGVTKAVLTDGSPACGSRTIRRGGTPVSGMGVAAALLIDNGVTVETPEVQNR